ETDWNGRAAIEGPSVRERSADFYWKVKGLEYPGWRTLTALSRGTTPGPENSIGKMIGAPLRQELCEFAMELQGAAGATLDPDATWRRGLAQLGWLGSPGLRLAGGPGGDLQNIPPQPRPGLAGG